MPAPQAHLDLVDAAELGELLTFISQWLGGTDHAQLAASFGRFMGIQGYDLADLRTDLARFTFLPGHDDGEQLFGHDRRDGHPIHRRQGDAMTDPSTPPALVTALAYHQAWTSHDLDKAMSCIAGDIIGNLETRGRPNGAGIRHRQAFLITATPIGQRPRSPRSASLTASSASWRRWASRTAVSSRTCCKDSRLRSGPRYVSLQRLAISGSRTAGAAPRCVRWWRRCESGAPMTARPPRPSAG